MVKRGGCKDSTWAHGMSPSACKHQGNIQGSEIGCRPKFWRVLQPLQHQQISRFKHINYKNKKQRKQA